mmetsp:Transcript_23069/g.91489  ORF Transcript_23069/g.91489 Transcript_23069/m.91489 type:complete len:987 (+) Transcript_23069:73-3033(+)
MRVGLVVGLASVAVRAWVAPWGAPGSSKRGHLSPRQSTTREPPRETTSTPPPTPITVRQQPAHVSPALSQKEDPAVAPHARTTSRDAAPTPTLLSFEEVEEDEPDDKTSATPTPQTTSTTKGEESAFGLAVDAVFSGLFWLLHLIDDAELRDSSKNLRVLWARAVLHAAGELEDPVAYELLPPATRGVAKRLTFAAKFGEFVTTRTQFADRAVDAFAKASTSHVTKRVVVLGAGFDTRAARFQLARRDNTDDRAELEFIEVDAPDVAAAKRRLWATRPFLRRLARTPLFVGFDLNACAGDADALRRAVLEQTGVDLGDGTPAMCVSEAVLFYVDADARRSLVLDHVLGSGIYDAVAVTDSLKPMLASPFRHDAARLFAAKGFEVVRHASRWGGAVHYVDAVVKTVREPHPAQRSQDAAIGTPPAFFDVDDHHQERRWRRPRSSSSSAEDGTAPAHEDGIGVSYFPIASAGARRRWLAPSFEDAWYAVGFSWQLDGRTRGDANAESAVDGRPPFATRLWGEPLVLFRSAGGRVTCLVDACPHRAAPLSMGRVTDDGALACFYHCWTFGADGQRLDAGPGCATRAKSYPAIEKDGLVYVWRGRDDSSSLPSSEKAAASLLPRSLVEPGSPDALGAVPTYAVDTVLDYGVGFEYVVENNLDSPHLFQLHDGSVPPIAGLGMTRANAHRLRLAKFVDDVGFGHVGRLRGATRPNKLVRFDAPNVVRHGGVSGFHEEFHVVPVAPGRSRVLLRQHLPKGPILSTLLAIPGLERLIISMVRAWNHHIALEDYSCLVGQAHTVDDLGAPRLGAPGLGDDLIAQFHLWRDEAIRNDGGAEPYFRKWVAPVGGDGAVGVSSVPDRSFKGAPFASYVRDARGHAAPVDDGGAASGESSLLPRIVFGAAAHGERQSSTTTAGRVAPPAGDAGGHGALGIRESFHRGHPSTDFPPANPSNYLPLWQAHTAAHKLLGLEANAHTLPVGVVDDAAPRRLD